MRGFTLLELVVALAIASGTLLTVIATLNHHLSVLERDRMETAAALLCRSKLDSLEAGSRKSDHGDFAPEHPELTWTLETLPAPLALLERKRVTVSWGDKGDQSLSMVRYVQKQ